LLYYLPARLTPPFHQSATMPNTATVPISSASPSRPQHLLPLSGPDIFLLIKKAYSHNYTKYYVCFVGYFGAILRL